MIGNGGGVALTFLFAALLVGGLALLFLVAVRVLLGGISRPDPTRAPETGAHPVPVRSEARRLLDERYARGELSTAEYRAHAEGLEEQA